MAKVTAAKLEDLWLAGNVYLPDLAQMYVEISIEINKSSDNEKFRFSQRGTQVVDRPGAIGTLDSIDEQSIVYPSFVALRDEVQQILAQTATNLRDTGTAIDAAAWAYYEADTNSEDNLKEKFLDEIGWDEVNGGSEKHADLIPDGKFVDEDPIYTGPKVDRKSAD